MYKAPESAEDVVRKVDLKNFDLLPELFLHTPLIKINASSGGKEFVVAISLQFTSWSKEKKADVYYLNRFVQLQKDTDYLQFNLPVTVYNSDNSIYTQGNSYSIRCGAGLGDHKIQISLNSSPVGPELTIGIPTHQTVVDTGYTVIVV